MFLSCENCNACCAGSLAGDAFGIPFGHGTPCSFLCKDKCTIYTIRPEPCKKYQCAWSQNIFTRNLKPTISNLLISVEVDQNKKQFLKIIPLNTNISQEDIDYLNNWVDQNETYYVVVGANDEIKHRFRSQKN